MGVILSLIPGRAWAYIAGIALFLMAAVGYVKHSEHVALEQERQRIERANNEARDKADAVNPTVDGCYASGGRWDRASGLCNLATHPETVRRDLR